MKKGDKLVIIYNEEYRSILSGVVGSVVTINKPKSEVERLHGYKHSDIGFIDPLTKVEWICCGERNYPKFCLRKLTKLDKALK